MNRTLQTILAICLLIATGFLSWALYQVGVAAKSIPVTESKILDSVTAVTKRISGQDGTLAELDKSILAAKSVLVHIDLVAAHEDRQIPRYDAYAQQTVSDIHGMTQAFTGTANAATETAHSASSTFQAASDALKPVPALLASGTDAENSFNVLLKRKALADAIDNVDRITGTSEDMLMVADQVERKATASYLHPSKNPWARTWNAVNPFIVAGAKVTAAIF